MFNCEQEIIKLRERDTKKEEANKKSFKKRVKYVKVYNSQSMCSSKRNGHVLFVV